MDSLLIPTPGWLLELWVILTQMVKKLNILLDVTLMAMHSIKRIKQTNLALKFMFEEAEKVRQL
jgi:hypothetical protein